MSSDVLTRVEGRIGRISLNRPKAIHALNREMCSAMIAALQAWRDSPDVRAILIDHAEGRGFCAGGDVVTLAKSGAGNGAEARAFFHEEYRLNHLLFTLVKPTIAFLDGITMGGGVGIGLPCTYRIATEHTRLAMPETAIGLFPDVGGGWYLSRLPGCVGKFLALTGARMDGAECLYLGLATHYIPSESLEDVKAEIAKRPDRIKGILGRASISPPAAKIEGNLGRINKIFAHARFEEILAALEEDESEWAQTELATLHAKSPQACKVSLRLLADGARMQDFADEMRQEYAVAAHVVQRPDFAEGVRAVLIDKDNEPRWNPPTPEAVSDHMIDTIFAPLPDGEEWDAFTLTGTRREDSMAEYETILVEQRGAVTLITLNRPKALNALNSQVLGELIQAFAAYDADDSQRCAILTGSERAFAAGADIKEMSSQGFAQMYAGNFFQGWETVTATRKPWIAAVSGYALGGGCEVAMMADFIIAADTAQFGQPEIKLGVTPGMGGSQRLVRAVGKAKAMEMCLTGRNMGAEEAERSGLVAKVVPADQLLDEALKTAEAIASMAPLAALATKEMINAAFETGLAQGILFERRLFHGLFGTDDQKEGMAAFVDKRKAEWKGR